MRRKRRGLGRRPWMCERVSFLVWWESEIMRGGGEEGEEGEEEEEEEEKKKKAV